ncbi:MAG: 50S ribosomal protein L35ae [Thermoprotei archaeon]|nr:MAG: 50S ribosomal protein L35ae [Thermoprotei archaeon]
MEAYIVSFRRGAKTQDERYVILEVDGVNSDSKAARLIGRKVVWRSPNGGFEVRGKIIGVHGRRGRVIARLRKPLPGQALGTKALIL